MKNRGFSLELEKAHAQPEDWIFGAISQKCLAQIPVGERDKYLPKGEIQFGVEDFMDCATRGPLNLLETKLNYLLKNKKLPYETWWRENGYISENGFELSDRFNAILSNTTQQGNSIKAPLDSIRKDGIIPKRLLYANQKMRWADYHNKDDITGSMLALGQNSLRHLSFNYEKVLEDDFDTFDDILDVAGYAWTAPINGVYPRSDNEPTHVWMNIRPKYVAFDNYQDSTDGDFIKNLAPDFNFYEYGYRVIISETIQDQYDGILSSLIKFLTTYVQFLKKSLGKVFGPSPLPA
jgi:hypothetical protein